MNGQYSKDKSDCVSKKKKKKYLENTELTEDVCFLAHELCEHISMFIYNSCTKKKKKDVKQVLVFVSCIQKKEKEVISNILTIEQT